jgi:hypothetical protein
MTAAFNPARSGQPAALDEAPDKELSTSDCRGRSHAFPPGRIVCAVRQTLPRAHSAGLKSVTSWIGRARNALQFLVPPMGRWPMLANCCGNTPSTRQPVAAAVRGSIAIRNLAAGTNRKGLIRNALRTCVVREHPAVEPFYIVLLCLQIAGIGLT